MKLKRGKKLMHVGSKTLASVNLKFSVGEMQFTFPTSRSKYWLDKDFAFVRVFGTIRATQDGRQRRYGVSQS